ncbi:MAG: 2-oxoacid:acceptor oxidoreductase family protein [Clostridiales bacterium]|jgi:2-oxoglutarate ferredoxin oxidoreductase subunit gamma|nr:2-oxoacid:acceptor oxidoreductase family protein [Clostridiales bacterium]
MSKRADVETKILIAGFGGQGILFAGKFLAYIGLLNGRQVSWLPSYGPEMRGGTASCSVVISNGPIGSPIVNNPHYLIVMNTPSLVRYEPDVTPGGLIFADNALITRKVERKDVQAFYIPATSLADEMGLKNLANMIILGAFIKRAGICAYDDFAPALDKTVPPRRKNLIDANLKALETGYSYD